MSNEVLAKLYYSPTSGLQSADKLYRKAKKIDDKITMKMVKFFLSQQETAQITKQEKKRLVYDRIIAHRVNNGHQADLLDMSKYKVANSNYKWILNIIDIYSRRAWAVAIKSKSAKDVAEAFENLYKDKKNIPEQITTDEGGEFLGAVQDIFVKHNIEHWRYPPQHHNTLGIVERFNRTLRDMIRRYWASQKTKQWKPVLDSFIQNYNESYHRTIDAEPMLVFTGKAYPKPPKTPEIAQFKVGDTVRRRIKGNIFAKKTKRFSEELYLIADKVGRKYQLMDIDTEKLELKLSNPQDLMLIEGVPQGVAKKIKDSYLVDNDIEKTKLETEWKQLDNDTSKILPEKTKRIRKKSSKLKDYV